MQSGGVPWINDSRYDPFLQQIPPLFSTPHRVYVPSSPSPIEDVRVMEPYDFEYNFGNDLRRHSSTFANVSLALATLNGRKDHHGEGNTRHAHCEGVAKIGSIHYIKNTSVYKGQSFPVYGGSPCVVGTTGNLTGSSAWAWNCPTLSAYLDLTLIPYLASMKGKRFMTTTSFGGDDCDAWLLDYSVVESNEEVRITEKVMLDRYRWFGYVSHTYAYLEIIWVFTPSDPVFVNMGASQDLTNPAILVPQFYCGTWDRSVILKVWKPQVNDDGFISAAARNRQYLHKSTVYPLQLVAESFNHSLDLGVVANDIAKRVRSQSKFFGDAALDDISTSAYVSSMRAVDDGITQLSHSFTESIREMSELLDLLPTSKDPIQRFCNDVVYSDLRNKIERTGVGKYLRLVDYASNAYLLYKFGLSGYAEDIMFFATNFDRIQAALASGLRGSVFRGKFSTVLNTGPFRDATLVTRSKVVMSIPSYAPAAFLMPFEAIGLLPSPVDIWNAAPWTFVIDWFLNIGGRINLGTNRVHALFLPVHYCVHSYTLYDCKVDVPGVDMTEAPIRHYIREVSQFLPSARSTSYDWLGVAPVPPAFIAGSLIWQQFRG